MPQSMDHWNSDRDCKVCSDASGKGDANIVITEALDCLSREREHIARVFKELSFAQAKIRIIVEG
jgi:hypothetical protein